MVDDNERSRLTRFNFSCGVNPLRQILDANDGTPEEDEK